MGFVGQPQVRIEKDAIGEAIKECDVPREQLFITTKLWNDDHGRVDEAFAGSLQNMQLDYVDLYLIHTPVQ